MPLTDIAVRSAKPQAKTVRLVQAPMALVACSALSSLSLATQGLSNVRRDHQLVGPISLYSLAVADSGERKTTSDAIFCPALRDWETARRQEMSPEIAKLAAATAGESRQPCCTSMRDPLHWRHDVRTAPPTAGQWHYRNLAPAGLTRTAAVVNNSAKCGESCARITCVTP